MSGKSSKQGRNKPYCKAYKDRGTEAKNKARNIKREEKRQAKAKEKKLKRLGI